MMEKQINLFEEMAEIFKPADSLGTFFNTTNLKGDELKHRRFKAGCQTDKVLQYFTDRPDRDYTPQEVQTNCAEFWDTPITSIRRAMTDLTKAGYLVKTDNKRMGNYNELTYTWKLK